MSKKPRKNGPPWPQHPVACIAENEAAKIMRHESALQGVRLVEAEIESTAIGRPIQFRLLAE